MTIERKGEKRNIYEDKKGKLFCSLGHTFLDSREWRVIYQAYVCVFLCSIETMENWDEATLEDVINKKHGESDSNKLKTAIVSSFINIMF